MSYGIKRIFMFQELPCAFNLCGACQTMVLMCFTFHLVFCSLSGPAVMCPGITVIDPKTRARTAIPTLLPVSRFFFFPFLCLIWHNTVYSERLSLLTSSIWGLSSFCFLIGRFTFIVYLNLIGLNALTLLLAFNACISL